MDPTEVVRTGYDVVSAAYRADDESDQRYDEWLEELALALVPGGRVLDLGCGVPAVRWLLRRGFNVMGIDLSPVQVERAKRSFPEAEIRCADMTELELPAGSLDAVVALYSVIHVPVPEQPALFESIHRWLRVGGTLLAIVGATAGTGTEDDWFGAPMYWSHADRDTYLTWLRDIGFELRWHRFIQEDDGGHTLLLVRK